MNKPLQDKICVFCKSSFKPSRLDSRLKYCSKICREKDWTVNNKERCRELSKRSRDKKPVLCRYCRKEIPLDVRKSGLVLCSAKCKQKHTKKQIKKARDIKFELFKKYKEEKGCILCEYNAYGGSLDFHHLNPKEKDLRITATNFIANSEKIKKELKKCILVCKNCHYELHYLMRVDITKYWTKLKNETR